MCMYVYYILKHMDGAHTMSNIVVYMDIFFSFQVPFHIACVVTGVHSQAKASTTTITNIT